MSIMRSWVVVILAVLSGTTAAAGDWEMLSGGTDLSGWRVLGGDWSIQEGVITGKAQAEENCWLLWNGAAYADCEIALEFRTPTPTNGGVQFRSHWLPRVPLKEGGKAEDAPKQMYGYQVNVETRMRLGTGKLIDENGRGTLAETPMAAAKTLTQRGWNTMRIVARGPVIEVYLGEVLAHRTEDEKYLKGSIALQVYGMEMKEEAVVQYRNVRVKDLGREGTWRTLFDGATLSGWKIWGEEEWTVEGGIIVGRSGPKKSEGYLATETQWKDFRVRAQFKMLGEGNFGLFYHSTITLRDDGYPVISGLQGEVEPGYPSKTGWVYESYKRGWLAEPELSQVGAVALQPGEWNELEIRSQGNHVTTWLNGVRVQDLVDAGQQLFEGSLALQLHTGGVDGIAWKELFIEE